MPMLAARTGIELNCKSVERERSLNASEADGAMRGNTTNRCVVK